MYFLISYELVDRDDLSTEQKMCAIYLARQFDEHSDDFDIDEFEMASKLRLSVDEVKLNIEVLKSKKIITQRGLSAQNSANSSVEMTVLEDSARDDSSEVSPLASLGRDDGAGQGVEMTVLEDSARDDGTEGYGRDDEFLKEKVDSAEKRVKERASQLKLNVRRKNKNSSSSSNYSRRKTDLVEEEENLEEEKYEQAKETEELLKLLAESNESIVKESESRLNTRNRKENINTTFLKASSVYNSTSPPRKKEEKSKIDKDLEV